MIALQIIVATFSCFLVLATLAPLLPIGHWLIRGWDFPRLQLTISLAVVFATGCAVFPFETAVHYLGNVPVGACLIYQLFRVFPYTPMWKKQVKGSMTAKKSRTISLLASNVYMPNQNVNSLLNLVWQKQPHVVLTLETNMWWQQQLAPLEKDYPHQVKVPLENLYGMHLYSKLPLEETEVRFLVKSDIPSIHTFVRLKSGERVRLHCLHPMPPSPSESKTSKPRDVELLLVGKNIDTVQGPVIVMGDLNDVAWSDTTRMFQNISKLLDPRRGRGFFNTFHAKYPILRWPLDHFFHSNHFTLLNLERLPYMGSDHFPMYISLHLEPQARHKQEEPEATASETAKANEKVSEATG